MTAIDIGANVGVYSLPLARAVGNTGRVFAFEPSATPRMYLEASRNENGFDSLHVLSYAISDYCGNGRMTTNGSSEFHQLTNDLTIHRDTANVLVVTLDSLQAQYVWEMISFLKIDAEGQEEKIVAGGKRFFDIHSPLVMYEITHKAGANRSIQLRSIFESIGYRSYRVLGDSSCLIPVESDEEIDIYTLNLFATKEDQAARLEREGLLVSNRVPHVLSESERLEALGIWLVQPYAKAFAILAEDVERCAFGEALVAYAAYRYGGLSPSRRYAALRTAFELLLPKCGQQPTTAMFATMVRIALDLGYRLYALRLLEILLKNTSSELDEPFFPPCERYERLSSEGNEFDWFDAAANEQWVLNQSHTSYLKTKRIPDYDELAFLKWIVSGPFSSPELRRRMILQSIVDGVDTAVLSEYGAPVEQHLNRHFWSAKGIETLAELTG